MRIKISVCIPVYKVEKLIERCARSLFEQTLAEGIEYIFVDDCSPDDSIGVLGRILLEYPNRKSQVRIVRHERNLGLIAARRSAIDVAQGDYIIHCDSDDAIDPSLYAKMLALAESKGLDVVVAPIKMIWPSGCMVIYESDCKTFEEYFRNCYATAGFNAMINKLIRKNIYDKTKIDVGECRFHGEDLLQTTQLLLSCASIGFVHDTYYTYYRNEESGTMIDKDDRVGVDQLLAVERVLDPKLSSSYPSALNYFRHVCYMRVLRSCSFAASEYQSLWPESRTYVALKSDKRLETYKKFLILLCAHNYMIGMILVRWLLWVQYSVRKIREGR